MLTFPGTNCDAETVRALRTVGFAATASPITTLQATDIDGVQLAVIPGGFSYGDYVMAGRLAQLEVASRLGDALHAFRDRGGFLLGICNGFQILLRLGLLPRGSLVANSDGGFLCRWVGLRCLQSHGSPFDRLPAHISLPVAHAEGRFVSDPGMAADYVRRGLVIFRYDEPVNGSEEEIAGLRDESGRVIGLMPHPERFLYAEDHPDPDWPEQHHRKHGWGYDFFAHLKAAVNASALATTTPT